MTSILVDNFANMIFETGVIERGIFTEADPNINLWKVTNDNGTFYAVATGFTKYTVEELPTEHDYHLYSYTPEEGFVYHKPPKSEEEIKQETEQQITDLQLAIVELFEMLA